MMKRIPEPDLMNGDKQALAYANADFNEPHSLFIELFRQTFSYTNIQGLVLDLGCGPADISIRFAKTYPRCLIEGVDGSKNMLKHGREAVIKQKLERRVDLICGYLPKAQLPHKHYDVIISNSLLHHLTDPMILWDMIKKYTTGNTSIFIMDLLRPDSLQTARQLVSDYAANEPAVLQEDFLNSLCASYRVDEITEQLQKAGLGMLKIKAVTDRHFIVCGRLG
jgi:ubiquinone/menaquinone biosynthesis C-methylase UbiE